MKKKSVLLTVVILLLAPGIRTRGQAAGVEAELRRIMQVEFDAFRLRDPSAYGALVADDAVYAGGGAKGYKTKADILEEMKKAPAFFASASLAVTDVQVRLYRDTAVMLCLATFKFKDAEGKDASLQFQMSRVHVRRDGAWRLVAHHATGVR